MSGSNILRILFFALGLVWLCILYYRQYEFKKKGILVKAKIIDVKQETGNYFPVYKFYFEGQEIVIDGHEGEKEPPRLGKEVEVYYIPDDNKGVATPEFIRVKIWQVVCTVFCIAYIIYGLVR